MPEIRFDFPSSFFAALRKSPAEFPVEMRVAASVQWYAEGLLSQGKAAEIAGLSGRSSSKSSSGAKSRLARSLSKSSSKRSSMSRWWVAIPPPKPASQRPSLSPSPAQSRSSRSNRSPAPPPTILKSS